MSSSLNGLRTLPITYIHFSPNTITLIGQLAMMLAAAICCYYSPDLYSTAPSWAYLTYAACIWFYSTMDNLDGKQARKTGSSSALGEIFDHSCDAVTNFIISILLISSTRCGPASPLAFTIWFLRMLRLFLFLPYSRIIFILHKHLGGISFRCPDSRCHQWSDRRYRYCCRHLLSFRHIRA